MNRAGLYEVWHGGKMIARVQDQGEAGRLYWEAVEKTDVEKERLTNR